MYFDVTTRLYSKMQHCSNFNHVDSCKLLTFLLNVFEDDSNSEEWRIRHSIDASIRFISLVCAFIAFVIQIIVTNKTYFEVSTLSDYYNGIFYCCLSFSCDLIYFSFVFLFNYHCNNRFNIWKPIIFMHNASSQIWISLLCVSILFAGAIV